VFRPSAGDFKTVHFSPDGGTLAAAGADDALMVWNARTGDVRATLYGHAGAVTACAFASARITIISGSDDHTLKLWQTGIGSASTRKPGSVALADLEQIRDARARIALAINHLNEARPEKGVHSVSKVLGCAFSADGQTLVVARHMRMLTLCDIPS